MKKSVLVFPLKSAGQCICEMVDIILESVSILAQYAGTACHVKVTKELNKQFCTPKEAGEHILVQDLPRSLLPATSPPTTY